MSNDSFRVTVARKVLGLTSTRTLRDTACDALSNGCDSPALRLLAVVADTDSEEARLLFDQSLAEMGRLPPTAHDAVMILARELAEKMLDGSMTPYDGAKQIWDLTLRLGKHVPDLDTFVYGASEWDDRPEDRNIFAEGILAAAQELVDADTRDGG